MKAITIMGPGDIRMVDTPRPVAGPKQIVCRVAYSGICGTDLAILSGDMKLVREGYIKYPVRIGHEWSGIVEETGSGVKGFKKGDRVVSDTGFCCGECEHCIEGRHELCTNIRSLGTINCWDGSFAEYMLVPEMHLYKLPDEIDLDEAALIEPAAISLAAVNNCKITSKSNVLIIGTGPIGLMTIPITRKAGAAKIIISGRKDSKLGIGKVMGADVTVNALKEDLKDIVMRETGGAGADVVIETSGNPDVINRCIDVMTPNIGFMSLIGFYETNVKDFDIDKIVTKGLQIKGVLGELGLPQKVIDIMKNGGISFKPVITHRFGFDEAISAMKTAGERNDTKVKMLVEMG